MKDFIVILIIPQKELGWCMHNDANALIYGLLITKVEQHVLLEKVARVYMNLLKVAISLYSFLPNVYLINKECKAWSYEECEM